MPPRHLNICVMMKHNIPTSQQMKQTLGVETSKYPHKKNIWKTKIQRKLYEHEYFIQPVHDIKHHLKADTSRCLVQETR